jgi:hypothetical protein
LGTPNYYVALGTQPGTLDLWKFHVDWQDPAKMTFGAGAANGPNYAITVPKFSFACNGTGAACIPQPARPLPLPLPEAPDSLGDRLMFRLAYRRFDGHDALVLTHSVDTGSGNTGIRWYELRSENGSDFSAIQTSTFAPDANHRWMGSVAMDGLGNIIVGYSISGAVFPGLRFAWRAPSDPPGQLRSEQVFTRGLGVQQCKLPNGTCREPCKLDDGTCDSLTRWGDYSNMTVDPADGCTLWYTGEFQKTTGVYNWHTQIGSLRNSRCTR